MNVTVVWLDFVHAKIFQISEEQMMRDTVLASHQDHHIHRKNGDEKDDFKMYDNIANKLSSTVKILILGPGLAKTHFYNFLKESYKSLAARVVACETTDHPSDYQIAAYAEKYFQKPVS